MVGVGVERGADSPQGLAAERELRFAERQRTGFTGGFGRSKRGLDEEKPWIRRAGVFGYHIRMG